MSNPIADLTRTAVLSMDLQTAIVSVYAKGREDFLPIYGLDPGDHRPRKEMAEVLNIFGEAKDGWGLAFWFAGLNSFLDDERPQDVLATDPALVIAAARDEMAELQHG